MDPRFPVMMTCPTRKVPADTGRRATRAAFDALEFEANARFTCPACGGEHLLERGKVFLGDIAT
jgi:hypothetical protein